MQDPAPSLSSQSPYDLMQGAVAIVGSSEHPANKIAAAIAGTDGHGRPYTLARVNAWPEPIRAAIGQGVEIGNSSGTVHAETACLLSAPRTDGAAIFVTDPPCPNCVKNMAEAGVRTLYIDHKGFDKDFAARRGYDYENLSLHICARAGIAVYKIFRREQRIEPILAIAPDYRPHDERPARMQAISGAMDGTADFSAIIAESAAHYLRRDFAVALAERPGQGGARVSVSADIHAIPGFEAGEAPDDAKYNFELQPVHRVLMNAARHGLALDRDHLYCSRVPTARELVNMVGAGFSTITLGDTARARDAHGLAALKLLTEQRIVHILT